MDDDSKQFVKGLSKFSVGPIISAILGFLIVPITTRIVTPYDFGKAAMYTMGYSISSIFIFLGLDQAFIREYNMEKNKSKLLYNSLLIPMISSILLGIIYIIFYKFISILIFSSIERYIVTVLAVSLPFSIVDRFSLLVIRMEENAKVYSLFNILNKIFYIVILIPYLIFVDNSFKGIINSTFITLIILSVLQVIYIKNLWKDNFYFDKKLIKKLLKFGLPIVPASLIWWIFSSMDRLALKQYCGYNEIGLYSAAFKIISIIGIFQQAFCTFWIPTSLRWYKENVDKSKFKKVSDMLSFFMIILFSGVILFKDLIMMILSKQYASASNIIPFLLIVPIMYTISETTTLGIVFSKKTAYNILISLISLLVNFCGNYILIPKWGALGASISTGVSYVVFFWSRTLISRRLWYKFSLKKYIINTINILMLATISVLFDSTFLNISVILWIMVTNKDDLKEVRKIFCNIIT